MFYLFWELLAGRFVLFHFHLGKKTVECCDYNGANRRVVYQSSNSPYYVAICNDTLYYITKEAQIERYYLVKMVPLDHLSDLQDLTK